MNININVGKRWMFLTHTHLTLYANHHSTGLPCSSKHVMECACGVRRKNKTSKASAPTRIRRWWTRETEKGQVKR